MTMFGRVYCEGAKGNIELVLFMKESCDIYRYLVKILPKYYVAQPILNQLLI